VAGLGGPAIAIIPDWEPPEPSSDKWDWIKMNSGEWLKGEIHDLNDDNFNFESDELDDLSLDWGDVAEFRSPRILTYTFEEAGVFTGTAAMKDSVISIRMGDQVHEAPRSDILTFIEGTRREWSYWSFKAGASLIARSGNSEQEDLQANVLVRRRATRLRTDLTYLGNYSQADSVLLTNNHRAELTFNYLFTRGFFITPFAGGLYSDEFQNIDLRATASVGLGVFLVRKSKIDWYIQLGGGYQSTTFRSVQEGAPTSDESGMIIPSTSLEMDITGSLELEFTYNAQITLPDPDGTFHHAFALFSYELSSWLDFDTSITLDRVENPKTAADGTVPEKNDFRTAFGLGLDF